MKKFLVITAFLLSFAGFTTVHAQAGGNNSSKTEEILRQNVVTKVLQLVQPIFYPDSGLSLGQLQQAYREGSLTITYLGNGYFLVKMGPCIATVLLDTSDF